MQDWYICPATTQR